MPNLNAHIGMAKEAITRINHPVLDRHIGSCLLGSASPDIRIITKIGREATHFAPLTLARVGEGMAGLFNEYPDLATSSGLTEETRCFIIGYACHLFADEIWIINMYRPFFGNRSVYEDELAGNLMDRALQLELDNRETATLGGLDKLRPLIDGSSVGVDIGFIESQVLDDWCVWVKEYLGWGFSWDRLRFMARRLNVNNDLEIELRLEKMVDHFLESVLDGTNDIYRMVPVSNVNAFREDCINEVVRFAREYL